MGNKILLYLHKVRYWIAALLLKHALKSLVRRNAKLLKGIKVVRNAKSRIHSKIDLSDEDYQLLFNMSNDVKGNIDIKNIEQLYLKLFQVRPLKHLSRLSCKEAIQLEYEIIRTLFNSIFHIPLDKEHLNVLKYFDSPVRVLQMFLAYCIKYKNYLQHTLYSLDEILDMFIPMMQNATVDDMPLLTPIDVELDRQQETQNINKYEYFRKMQAIKAKNLGKKIHIYSIDLLGENRRQISSDSYENYYCQLINNRKKYIDLNKKISFAYEHQKVAPAMPVFTG